LLAALFPRQPRALTVPAHRLQSGGITDAVGRLVTGTPCPPPLRAIAITWSIGTAISREVPPKSA
jgi:hypothetical protein